MAKKSTKKAEKVDYHKRPEWSYSGLKVVLTDGVEVAVAKKLGIIPDEKTAAMAFGSQLHNLILGGDERFFTAQDGGFNDYRTVAAREWKAKQEAEGKISISAGELENVKIAVNDRVLKHTLTSKLLLGEGWKHEVEMYATVGGLDMRGKADALKIYEEDGRKKVIITDIKTTRNFKGFVREGYYEHYDLQGYVYSYLAAAACGIPITDVEYYFCVVENHFPFQVKYVKVSQEALETGSRKLQTCIEEVLAYGDKVPDFLITEVEEIGDWSL